MALTAYSGDFLGKAGIQEFDKLSLLVPGFVVQNQSPNNPGLVMRGLNLDSGDATQEPRVSVFEERISNALISQTAPDTALAPAVRERCAWLRARAPGLVASALFLIFRPLIACIPTTRAWRYRQE